MSRMMWLIHEVRGRPAGRFQPWWVSGPGIHDELQRLVCWYAVRLATDAAKDGMSTGDYGAEYARKIRPVGHGSVGDEVVLSNA